MPTWQYSLGIFLYTHKSRLRNTYESLLLSMKKIIQVLLTLNIWHTIFKYLLIKKIKNSLISNERLLKLALNKRMITMNSSLNQFFLCSNIKRERINLSKDKYYEDEWQNNILSEIN